VRPIKAEEITPGVPFSWKCFQTTVKEVEEEAAKGGSGSATTTTVSCNLDFTTLLETCTATVVGGKTPPTGTVTFSSAAGGGVFTFGNTCTLTPGGPGTPNASCHVAYIPPSKTLTLISSVAISAVYGGDGTHQDSSSRTSLLASQQAAVESAASGSGSFNASEALSHGRVSVFLCRRVGVVSWGSGL
jgi:hypothetical protein